LQTQLNKWTGDKRPEGSIKTQQEPDGTRSVRVRKPVKEYGVIGNVWVIGTGHGKSTKDKCAFEHPAIFPEELVRRHIATWSNPGDVVLDYFGGSGTTAKMARKNGRRWLTNDISIEYCELMERRLAAPYTLSFLSELEAQQ
jgi:site-specific DNA-methyltransferase (adenine-specific)